MKSFAAASLKYVLNFVLQVGNGCYSYLLRTVALPLCKSRLLLLKRNFALPFKVLIVTAGSEALQF